MAERPALFLVAAIMAACSTFSQATPPPTSAPDATATVLPSPTPRPSTPAPIRTEAPPETIGPAAFRDTVLGSGDLLVTVGGDSTIDGAEAWTSNDGIHWTRAVIEGGESAELHSVAYGDDVYFAAGVDVAGDPAGGDRQKARAAFWTSSDGTSWARVPDDPEFALGDYACCAELAGVTELAAYGGRALALGKECTWSIEFLDGQCRPRAWIGSDDGWVTTNTPVFPSWVETVEPIAAYAIYARFTMAWLGCSLSAQPIPDGTRREDCALFASTATDGFDWTPFVESDAIGPLGVETAAAGELGVLAAPADGGPLWRFNGKRWSSHSPFFDLDPDEVPPTPGEILITHLAGAHIWFAAGYDAACMKCPLVLNSHDGRDWSLMTAAGRYPDTADIAAFVVQWGGGSGAAILLGGPIDGETLFDIDEWAS